MNLMAQQGFAAKLEKVALSPALLGRWAAGRAAQGVGGAAAMGRGIAGAAAQGATTSRQVMGQMGGLGQHRLQGVVAGGRDARAAAALPTRLGVAPQHAAFKARTAQMDSALRTAPETVTAPFAQGSAALGTTRGYHPAAAEFMAGKGTLASAQATAKANPAILTPSGAIPTNGKSTVGAAVTRRPPAPAAPVDGTISGKKIPYRLSGLESTQVSALGPTQIARAPGM